MLMLFTSFWMVLTQGSFCYPCLAGPTLLLLAESQEDAHQQGEGWRGWIPAGGSPGWHLKGKPLPESFLFPLYFSRITEVLEESASLCLVMLCAYPHLAFLTLWLLFILFSQCTNQSALPSEGELILTVKHLFFYFIPSFLFKPLNPDFSFP